MQVQYQLIRLQDNAVILAKLKLATTFWQRFVGLQFARPLSSEEGLWLAPCSSLHTCFMRFSIDVASLDKEGRVLEFRRNLKPWRAAVCPRGTHSIVEAAAGAILLSVGDRLKIEANQPL